MSTIIGAIAGDVIGSVFEWNNIKTTKFSLFTEETTFTDDTILTIAVADSILNNKDFESTIKHYANKYSDYGYGASFRKWFESEKPEPYNSWGNGSAMRVSPVGFAFNSLDETLTKAKESAIITHNHPEGIKGAQAVAAAIYHARNGKSKEFIRNYISQSFGYNLKRSIDEIRPSYKYDVSCQGSVPEAIISFIDSTGFEDAIRLAISIGGDSDTIACIAGGIASSFYKTIPDSILVKLYKLLPLEFINIIDKFDRNFN